MGPWSGELPYILLRWVLKMLGGSLISESGHIACSDLTFLELIFFL